MIRISTTILALGFSIFAPTQGLVATPVATGFQAPVAVVPDPTNKNVIFVVELGGKIWPVVNSVRQPQPFLTVDVDRTSGAAGLLGMEFAPDYATSRKFYVHYNRPNLRVQISSFLRSSGNPLLAEQSSEQPILNVTNNRGDHFAGALHFGRDGFLYVPHGDGGGDNDPDNLAQNPMSAMGKVLRIDPSFDDFPLDLEKNYRIPPTNPFLDSDPIVALPEIWSFGMRNPWKFSFDRWDLLGTGAMLIADVGENAREEVNYERTEAGGRNYGWRVFEGSLVENPGTLAYGPHMPPFFEYDHSVGFSITGGVVYRGLELGSSLFGHYFFADWVTGKLWSIEPIIDSQTGEATGWTNLVEHSASTGNLGNIVSIDQDCEGEIYVLDFQGTVFKLSRSNQAWLTGVDRIQGVFVGGQVRSLLKANSHLLEIKPFSPFATNNKVTTFTIAAKTNQASHQNINVQIVAKANQNVAVPTAVQVYNWTTNSYELASNVMLSGSFSTQNLTCPAENHIEAGTGNMLFKLTSAYSGPLLFPNYKLQFDLFQVILD